MVQDNHLSCEAKCFHWWVIFAVTNHITMMNIFDSWVLVTEAHMCPQTASLKLHGAFQHT
ncbi:unnamed protein product [Gulo gulo]|uniref:Uncharacterized protein n=1 Tax=Gulo gulo TaxID=48420 RepID=A0A9X9LDF2_GULGU|nr:unnamed protein product [Gulo gulo]